MTRRRLWAVSALDLVFLLLGSILLAADGFERGLAHLRIEFARAAGGQGPVRTDSRAFTVAVRAEGVFAGATRLDLEALQTRASAARADGATHAKVLVGRRVPAELLLPALAVLDSARFPGIDFVYEKDNR